MSKIQDAVSRIRGSGGKAPSGGAHRRTSHPANMAIGQQHIGLGGPSPLEKCARRVSLDSDFLAKQRVIASHQSDATVTAYKMLRTRMLQRLRSNNWNRIAVSSARRNAGKTLTAINTAISLSSEPNQYVILVDLDLRRPTVAQSLGIEHDVGMSDFLLGNARYEDIIVQTDIERLLVIPNYGRLENSSETMTSNRMIEFVSTISSSENSTLTIFDLPPLMEADDLLAFSPQLDAMLLVVAERETKQADFQRSVNLVEHVDVLGYVLNKSKGEDFGDGYYY